MKEFNSQICTTIKQSQRLLELGLNPETADMKHFFDDKDDYPFFHRWEYFPYGWNEESLVDSENIPAWSLHRLIELYKDVEDISLWSLENVNYNCLIQRIGLAIEHGAFNKEYLKQ